MTVCYNIYKLIFSILSGIIISLSFISCGGGSSMNKNPYCEFVDGKYTFDIDLRRSIFYTGKDFGHKYYDENMKETDTEDAVFVKLKAMGHYYDENIHEEEDLDLFYSSLIKLPAKNEVVQSTTNLFTTLECERIIYLVRSGYTYEDARKEVKKEIWEQLKDSKFFTGYDFINLKDFEDLKADDICLNALTAYFSKMIINTADVVEDKSLCSSVLIDFITNYSVSGDLELHTLDSDILSDTNYLYALSDEEMLLKSTVTYYHLPFEGGVPNMRNNKIYYGLDTSSFKEEIDLDNKYLKLLYPLHKEFEFNGYFNIKAFVEKDTLEADYELIVDIKDLETNKSDTTYNIPTNMLQNISRTLWFNKSGRYNVSLTYGDESVQFNAVNKFEYSDDK